VDDVTKELEDVKTGNGTGNGTGKGKVPTVWNWHNLLGGGASRKAPE
jgi:hypothetical protein